MDSEQGQWPALQWLQCDAAVLRDAAMYRSHTQKPCRAGLLLRQEVLALINLANQIDEGQEVAVTCQSEIVQVPQLDWCT